MSIAAAPSSKALNTSLSNTLSSQYQVASTQNAISVIIKFEGYNMPAAHPYHNIDTIIFDINKRQVISLDKLFKTQKDYLEFISNKARELLQAQRITDSNVLQSGTQPYLNNFINWSITENRNIRIDFENYQVGAYVLGEPHIIIDKHELKPLLSTYGRQLLLGQEGYMIK